MPTQLVADVSKVIEAAHKDGYRLLRAIIERPKQGKVELLFGSGKAQDATPVEEISWPELIDGAN
jgi:hypothetical protein